MRNTPPAKTAAVEAPTLDLFSAPALPARAPRSAGVPATRSKAASVPAIVPGKSAPRKPALAKPIPAAVKVPAAVKPASPKSVPMQTAKTAKTISVRAVSTPPVPVRVVAETPATYFTGAGGRAWRMSGKHAVAYVRDAGVAGELLATEPRHLAKSAMAVYYDRKGKPFAWQLRFDTARWEEVIGRLG